jgi:hypothetical protein
VSEPVGGRPDARWIEGAGIDQRPVGPAAGTVVDVADRLARLEGRRRVSVPKLHPALRGADRGVGAGCLLAGTDTPPFFRDSAASPISDRYWRQAQGDMACSNWHVG